METEDVASVDIMRFSLNRKREAIGEWHWVSRNRLTPVIELQRH
jgi:hypothetical protein